MAAYQAVNNTLVISGVKRDRHGDLAVGAYTQLIDIVSGTVIGRTSTDKNGAWSFVVSTPNIASGRYVVQFHHSKLLDGMPPDGDWEAVDVFTVDAKGSVNLNGTMAINSDGVALASDLEMEDMKANFQYVSWAQFAVYDSFDSVSRRDPADAGSAVIWLGELVHGDSTPNGISLFHSKTYFGITTLWIGNGLGAVGSISDSSKAWFVNEVKALTLEDSVGARFVVNSNTDQVVNVAGTPASGTYKLIAANPTVCFAFCTYKDSTNGVGAKYKGFTKLEFGTDDGQTWVTLLDTEHGIDKLGSVVSFATEGHFPGSDYKVRLTLKNDVNGDGPYVQNFLIATDPSIWRF